MRWVWGLAIANIAVELDICRHLSFNFPVCYSAWNYFSETVKFRTLSMQPELRVYIPKTNEGFFVGAHGGTGYYNVAVNGALRTQDHDGRTPAIGGGLSLGYKLPVSGNRRWHLDLSVGGGVYKLHYDQFHNCRNGLLVHTGKKTYFGLDQANVSVAYSFDLKRGKSCREDAE